ncbi:hypothetical protein P12x_000095 [Tundrisphaera lichenicola]|uniref:hypothetical protein n=1 Tax=Tundrisphaera lichenicola TaxID=2029860 RepID=UPI003EBA2826
MPQATTPDSTALPRPIARALRRVDARLRGFASARGLGLTALVASVGVALGMIADFSGLLALPVRWAIWGVWILAIGLGLGWWVVRPLMRRSRWIDLAAVAERADPSLGERLTGSVALLDRAGPTNGSPALIAALAREASEHVGSFDPSLVEGGKRAIRWLILGILAAVIVVAPAVIRPEPFRTLAMRFLAPWRDLERVGWFALTVLPGDKTLAIGSDLKVEAVVSPRFGTRPAPESAWLEWIDADGKPRRSRMTARAPGSTPERSYEATLPRVAGSLSYRVTTEAARSRAYRVTAVEPPRVSKIAARVEPPAYTQLPPGPARDPSRIEAVEGSTIVLSVETNTPVESIELNWPEVAKPIALTPAGKGMTATLRAEASGSYVLTPRRDRNGLDGPPESRLLAVRPDLAPSLAVRGPGAPSEARPDDVLQVGVAARDDFAVASAELHYEVRRSGSVDEVTAGRVELKLEGLGSTVARGFGSIRLGDLAMEPGDSLSYRVKILDNRPEPKGPNVVWSDARALSIVASAESLQAAEDRSRREAFGARLNEIRLANRTNRRETEQLRYAADAAQRDGAAWDADRDAALDARMAEARSVVDRLQILARDLEDDPTYLALARPARQAAEVEAEAGRAQLEKARKADDPGKRLAELRVADGRLGALGTRLDELQRRFEALSKLDLDRQKLRDIAGQEDALARKAAEAADQAKVAAEQEELRKALDDLVEKSPGLRAGVLAAQAEEASKLAQAARALAERQRAEARQTAEGPRAEGPLRALAQIQRALEDDARRLALEVDDPLAENARPRLDVDALRRASEPIEAGNLPEAVRRLDEAEDSLRRLARDVEDVPADARSLARRLARRQEILSNDVIAAVAEARQKDALPADEQAALADRLEPLGDRQAEIARLASGIVPPEPQQGIAREATQATDRASENLRGLRPRGSEGLQNAAKRALNQLADSLPDPDRRRDEARKKLDEARRQAEEVARDLERSLAETAPKGDRPDEARAAFDLAERLAPLLPKAREAAALLAALDLEPRVRPQRDRAAGRVGRLALAMQAVRDQAPARKPDSGPKPPANGWQILGPFPTPTARLPFDPARPINFGEEVRGPVGPPLRWKPATIEGEEGRVNLARAFERTDNQSAFAVAEIPNAAARKARLSIGSDDTATVWLNGKKVFEFDGNRAFAPGQDQVEVGLIEGINRLVVRCGNGNSDWQFAVGITPPPPEGFDPGKARSLRETLAASRADARGALDRLDQKARGKLPADDLAEILADEQRIAADRLAEERSKPPEEDPTPREEAALDRQRIATAIRNLPVADEAPAPLAEAIRLAGLSAPLEATPEAARKATEAIGALARKLAHEAPAPPADEPTVPADPELGLGPEQMARATDLVRRQRQIRERLQSVMADRVTPQEDLRRDAQKLGQDLAQLRDRAREIKARSQDQAGNAADLAGQKAPEAMQAGAEQLARGQTDQARESQRQAADLLERAARETEDLAAGLQAEGKSEAGDAPIDTADSLAQAREAIGEAARKLSQAQSQADAQAASPSMRQAAEALRAAARSEGAGPPAPPIAEASPDNPDPTSAAAGTARADLSELQDLIRKKSGRKWGELPGHLRTEILQHSQGRYRDDYARLIQLYFREIAADASRGDKP